MTELAQGIDSPSARLLHGVDASRRVGFAKYYSERAKADELSHDLNVAREDTVLFERAFAFMWGFANEFQHLQTGSPISKEVREVLGRFRGVVDIDASGRGQTAARYILDLHAGGKRSSKAHVDRLIAREKAQGRRTGRRQLLMDLQRDGLLSVEDAAKYLDDTP